MEFLNDCFRYREKRLPEELLLLENMTFNIFSKWNNDYCNVFFPENIVPFLKKYVELKNKKQLTSEETNDVGIVDSYMIVSKRFWKDNINTKRAYKTTVIRFLTSFKTNSNSCVGAIWICSLERWPMLFCAVSTIV